MLCHEQGIESEERAEEIADEIGKTLLYSQQLREKLALNLHKERQNLRKPSIQDIYSSSTSINKNQAKLKASSSQIISKVEKENFKNTQRPRRSASQQRSPSQITTTTNLDRTRSSSTTRFRSTKVLEPSPDNILAKTTMLKSKNPTNFILANKLSVKGSKPSSDKSKQFSASCGDVRKIGNR